MRNTTLSKKQHAARKLGIGGSDAKKIMDGEWTKLWKEKTGRADPDDLTTIFKIQLGISTEAFNLEWLEKTTGWLIDYPEPDKTYIHRQYDFIRCHPDAWAIIDGVEAVIDAKHLAPKAPWNDEQAVLERYFWQAQHNMAVMNRMQFVLSCIWGNEWGDPLFIDRDNDKIAELEEREEAFWWHVKNDKPPIDMEYTEIPKISMDDMRTVDMEGNNEWCSDAVDFLDNQNAAKKFEKAKKDIKAKIEPDVKHAFGHSVEGVRAKNGNLTIRKIKEKK
jgi:predicted phage-related endonuclease